MSIRIVIITLIISSLLTNLNAQADCSCNDDPQINICYIPRLEYCSGSFQNNANCGVTFDGGFYENAISLKLVNTDHFGIDGTVECVINLQPIENLSNAKQISDADCQIFFVGAFPVDTFGGFGIESEVTALPNHVLESIFEWSIECPQNLTIVTQAESAVWGYNVNNGNQNPDTPVPNSNSPYSIFDGPFGSVSQFNQGGSYQGVFVETPSTGFETLAIDANDRPAMVLDLFTNDIVIGDIGIFSSGGAGDVSSGENIITSNDVLACNIFALGCTIATGNQTVVNEAFYCQGDLYTFVDGTTDDGEGIFSHTVLTADGCDSTVVTFLRFFEIEPGLDLYEGCVDDGFEIIINNNTYNEQNPIGTEQVISVAGCDSITNIEMIFYQHTEGLIDDIICENGNYSVSFNGNTYNAQNPSGVEIIPNFRGCDSTITIELDVLPISFDTVFYEQCIGDGFELAINGNNYNELNQSGDEVLLNQFGCDSMVNINIDFRALDTLMTSYGVCPDQSINIKGTSYISGENGVLQFPQGNNLCDSVLIFDVYTFDNFSEVVLEEIVTVDINSPFTFENSIPAGYTASWSPQIGLSCYDCLNPTVLGGEDKIENYELVITDLEGCQLRTSIDVLFNQLPYIPNAFAPQGNLLNTEFSIIFGDQVNTETIELESLTIYDEWGGIMHEALNQNVANGQYAWNGRSSQQNVENGVYLYVIKLRYFNGEKVNLIGNVTLLN